MRTKQLQVIPVLALVLTLTVAIIPSHASTGNSGSFAAVYAGGTFGLALTGTGDVWTWGQYYMNHTEIIKSTPVQLPISNVTAIAAGFNYGIALKNDGTVWAWGDNNMGQLGDGTTVSSTASLTPVEVKGLTHVIAISTGRLCSYALKDDDTLWAWGSNSQGQLGDVSSKSDTVTGNTAYSSVPIMVKGLTNVVAIGKGGPYAIESDGSVWAWGSNVAGKSPDTVVYGSLGDNQSGIRTPFRMENIKTAKAIASGGAATYALENNGTLWAWGLEESGVLGNGIELPIGPNANIPPCILLTQVKINDVVAVSAGSTNAIALRSDGTVWVWGQEMGQDQNSFTSPISVPTQVNGLNNIVDVSANGYFYIALKNDGTVWTWGNGLGEFNTDTPKEILGGSGGAKLAIPTITPSMAPENTVSTINGSDLKIAGIAGIVIVIVTIIGIWIMKKR